MFRLRRELPHPAISSDVPVRKPTRNWNVKLRGEKTWRFLEASWPGHQYILKALRIGQLAKGIRPTSSGWDRRSKDEYDLEDRDYIDSIDDPLALLSKSQGSGRF